MEHISLYRKYRPRTFDEVVGQPHVTRTLKNALSGSRMAHAYLFCGPRGTGKTSTARILAKAINCVEGPTADPCNSCEACTSISEGSSFDVIEIDAASNRKIDEIRELLDRIPYIPTSLRTKIYIVDEVHQLTNEASSALLKTLEEPPGHVVFVLATTEPHKILPTIVSRCQRFDFALVSAREIARLLERVAAREGIEAEPEAIGMIAENARGSVRDAIGVMDQISSISEEKVTPGQVAELLGEIESSLIFEMVDLIAERDTPGSLSLVGRVVESGRDPRRFAEATIAHLRNIFLVQNAAKPATVVEATEDHYIRLEEQAKRMPRYEVVRLIERLGVLHREMRWSESARMLLECELVKVTRADVDVSMEGLLFRLEQLEKKVQVLDSGGDEAHRTRREERADTTDAGRLQVGGGREPGGAGRGGGGVSSRRGAPPPAGGKGTQVPGVGAGAEDSAGGPEGKAPSLDPEEREELTRGWMAVLAELKKRGKMRPYSVLTRARVVSADGNGITLSVPEETSVLLGSLGDSGDIALVEEIWGGLRGGPVRLSFSMAERGPGAPGGAGARDSGIGGGGAEVRRKEPGEGNAPGSREGVTVKGGEGDGRENPVSREVAKLIRETFNGETLE